MQTDEYCLAKRDYVQHTLPTALQPGKKLTSTALISGIGAAFRTALEQAAATEGVSFAISAQSPLSGGTLVESLAAPVRETLAGGGLALGFAHLVSGVTFCGKICFVVENFHQAIAL